jgi:FAD/FMN-containing dehydrogenase
VEPELFWGLRGAGANLAVVTRLQVALVPVAEVVAGEVEYPREQAGEVLDAFARQSPPDHLTAMVVLRPPGPGSGVTVQAMSTADPGTAWDALAGVLPGSGRPVWNTFASAPYREAATLGGTFPAGFALLDRLGPETIGRLLDIAGDPRTTQLEIRHWGGAPSRPDGRSGPVGHRQAPFSVTVDGPPDAVAAAAAAAASLGNGGSFLNFLRDPDRTATAYSTADYGRLRRLKAAVDPGNVLGAQHNIPPAG